jgi:quercetin dioxygenase-like cupin family protein
MNDRTIENPVTGERATFVETSRETAGARTIADVVVGPGGGVFTHSHEDHEERIDVLDGEIEVRSGGVTRRIAAGGHVVIPRGTLHVWRNPSGDRTLRFRGMMTPGHPRFELSLRVVFGLGRDGELRSNGMPRRLQDAALLVDWDPSLVAGPARLLVPFLRWAAHRPRARRRAAELLRRYAPDAAA